MSGRRTIWKRILKAMGCLLILCLLGLLVFVKYRAGPEYARMRLERAMSRFWDGQVRLEDVRFTLSGRTYFKGVSLLDSESREWAYATTIITTLGNWPSRRPYLRAVEIDNLAVKLHPYTRKAAFPLKAPSRRSTKKKKKHRGVLQTLTVKDGSVEAIDLNRGRINFGRLSVSANRKADRFEIESSIAKDGRLNDIVAKGMFDTTNSQVNFSLTADRDLTGEEFAPLISLLNRSIDVEIAGRLKADIDLRGRINNLRHALIRGDIRCANGSISVDDETAVA
ncbi:MAG: hypothetical protein ACYSW8_24150, partial [Planctomycetota bacterium]